MARKRAVKPVASTGRFRDRIKGLERLRAGDMEEHPQNWRLHPGAQMAAVSGLLSEVGKVDALLAFPADGKGPDGDFSRLMMFDGHLRRSIDPEEVWPVIVTDLTRAEADKMILAIDPTAAMAEADPVKLRTLLDGVSTTCQEVADMLTRLWEDNQPPDDEPPADPQDAEPQTDRAAELMEKWGTAAGQLWLVGKHRLLIGDCRKPEDMVRLCGKDKINVAFTSPPYASQRKYDESSGFKPIKPDEYVAWWEAVQANVRRHLADDGSFFVNITEASDEGRKLDYVKRLVLQSIDAWQWVWIEEYCWPRPALPLNPNISRRFKNGWESVYHFACSEDYKFRPDDVRHKSDGVFSYADQKAAGKMIGGDAQGKGGGIMSPVNAGHGLAYPSNVLEECNGGAKIVGHSAAFPIGLPSFFIRAFSDEGDLILDPFLGSGTTMIAAENHNRRAAGIEISAQYAGVILQRYADAFPDQEIKLGG
jgi:site-specific DNA-methyltransferase (adenine-specific)